MSDFSKVGERCSPLKGMDLSDWSSAGLPIVAPADPAMAPPLHRWCLGAASDGYNAHITGAGKRCALLIRLI